MHPTVTDEFGNTRKVVSPTSKTGLLIANGAGVASALLAITMVMVTMYGETPSVVINILCSCVSLVVIVGILVMSHYAFVFGMSKPTQAAPKAVAQKDASGNQLSAEALATARTHAAHAAKIAHHQLAAEAETGHDLGNFALPQLALFVVLIIYGIFLGDQAKDDKGVLTLNMPGMGFLVLTLVSFIRAMVYHVGYLFEWALSRKEHAAHSTKGKQHTQNNALLKFGTRVTHLATVLFAIVSAGTVLSLLTTMPGLDWIWGVGAAALTMAVGGGASVFGHAMDTHARNRANVRASPHALHGYAASALYLFTGLVLCITILATSTGANGGNGIGMLDAQFQLAKRENMLNAVAELNDPAYVWKTTDSDAFVTDFNKIIADANVDYDAFAHAFASKTLTCDTDDLNNDAVVKDNKPGTAATTVLQMIADIQPINAGESIYASADSVSGGSGLTNKFACLAAATDPAPASPTSMCTFSVSVYMYELIKGVMTAKINITIMALFIVASIPLFVEVSANAAAVDAATNSHAVSATVDAHNIADAMKHNAAAHAGKADAADGMNSVAVGQGNKHSEDGIFAILRVAVALFIFGMTLTYTDGAYTGARSGDACTPAVEHSLAVMSLNTFLSILATMLALAKWLASAHVAASSNVAAKQARLATFSANDSHLQASGHKSMTNVHVALLCTIALIQKAIRDEIAGAVAQVGNGGDVFGVETGYGFIAETKSNMSTVVILIILSTLIHTCLEMTNLVNGVVAFMRVGTHKTAFTHTGKSKADVEARAAVSGPAVDLPLYNEEAADAPKNVGSSFTRQYEDSSSLVQRRSFRNVN
jgi:hypothetical protein